MQEPQIRRVEYAVGSHGKDGICKRVGIPSDGIQKLRDGIRFCNHGSAPDCSSPWKNAVANESTEEEDHEHNDEEYVDERLDRLFFHTLFFTDDGKQV